MIAFKRIDHIHICVPAERLEEARHFYTDVMGLPEIARPASLNDAGIWFKAADIELHIAVEEQLPQSERHTAFEVTNLAEAKQHLMAHGISVKEQRPIAGRNRFSFHDPFGNRMELLQMD